MLSWELIRGSVYQEDSTPSSTHLLKAPAQNTVDIVDILDGSHSTGSYISLLSLSDMVLMMAV